MSIQRWLGVVVVLQVLILVGQWVGNGPARAQAQVPDAGAQRDSMIDELKAVNANLDKQTQFLESGKLQVVVAKPDDTQSK